MTPPQAHFQRFQVTIEFLSPVHIGSGHSIEPYEYDIKRNGSLTNLVIYDLTKALTDLNPIARRELNAVLDKCDFPGIRSWLRQHADASGHRLFEIEIVKENDPAKRIEKHLDNPERKLAIDLFTRHAATGVPYIPGSSIKGAIRTAVLDEIASDRKDDASLKNISKTKNGQRLEASLQRASDKWGKPDPKLDPFRQLAISDTTLHPDSCFIDQIKIVMARDCPTDQSGPGGIDMFRDLTWSLLEDDNRKYVTEMRIFEKLWSNRATDVRSIPYNLSCERVIAACNRFYLPKLRAELERFPTGECVARDLLKAATSIKQNQCLIRLGRHHHWDCGVISHFADSTSNLTRSFVAGEFPLGWTRLTFDPCP